MESSWCFAVGFFARDHACSRPATDRSILFAHGRGTTVLAKMRFLTRKFTGHDLVGLACLAVEVKNKLERRCQPTIPVAGQSRPLIPDVPGKPPPALGAYPVKPAIPVRNDFVVAVDQPEIDQHLAIDGHRQLIEYAAHQGIPINDGVGDHVGALLCRREVTEFDDWHLGEPGLAGSGQTAVAGNDAVAAIHQDRVGSAEFNDAGREFGDLRLGMRARNACADCERTGSASRPSGTRRAGFRSYECKNPPQWAGPRLGGNSVQVVTGVVTGNPGNLVLRSDAIEMPGCRLPHGIL